MPRKYTNIEFKKRIRIIKNAGLKEIKQIDNEQIDELDSINKRIEKILNISNELKSDKSKMLFFVMYDIESNKVRREIAKYLQSKGCVRVQKSIFFASVRHEVFSEIHKTVKDVQEFYDNNDSILIIPVSTDEIKSMKIIGQNIDFDIVMNNRNTLFF